jgi:malate synthase
MTPRSQLSVASVLARFIEEQVLPGTGITPDTFWQGTAEIFQRFAPENRALLAKRDSLQAQIDAWHRARAGQPHDAVAY